MSAEPTVFVVDDDLDVRIALKELLSYAGYRVELHDSGEGLLETLTPARPGCAIVDIRMPGMGGMLLQQTLEAKGVTLPLIFLTAYGEIAQAVRAFRHGAADFLEKPVDNHRLLACVRQAMERDRRHRRLQARREELCHRWSRLSPRERMVLEGLVDGLPHKEIARRLNIKLPTVESHRRHILDKMQARNQAELVRMAPAWRQQDGSVAPVVARKDWKREVN